MTEGGQQFLFLDDTFQNRNYRAFATRNKLQDCTASEMYISNGTFYNCSSRLSQSTYWSMTEETSSKRPITRKESTNLHQMLQLLDKINDLGLQFSPPSALAYFETEAHRSIQAVLHGITTKGCCFPLHPRNMEKGTSDRTTDILQRRRQHEAIDKKNCSSPSRQHWERLF